MNTKLYQEYHKHLKSSVGFFAFSFNLPEYLLEEEFRNAYSRIEKQFDPEKATIQTYANAIFKNIAINLCKSFKDVSPDPEYDLEEYDRYINQEQQIIFKSAIDSMSDASRLIVDWILTNKTPKQETKKYAVKEKIHIKNWLIEKGWHPKKVDGCFSEIKQMLQEVAV